MSSYADKMRSYADKVKAKQQAKNQQRFEEAKSDVIESEERVRQAYEEFAKEYSKLGEMQRQSNEKLFHKDLEIAQQKIAIDRDVDEARQAFEALKAEFGIEY